MKKLLFIAMLFATTMSFAQNYYTPLTGMMYNSVDCDTMFVRMHVHLVNDITVRANVIKFSETNYSGLIVGRAHLEACEVITENSYMQWFRVNDLTGSTFTVNCNNPNIDFSQIIFQSGATLSSTDVNIPPRYIYEDSVITFPNDWNIRAYNLSGQLVYSTRGQSLVIDKPDIYIFVTDRRTFKIKL